MAGSIFDPILSLFAPSPKPITSGIAQAQKGYKQGEKTLQQSLPQQIASYTAGAQPSEALGKEFAPLTNQYVNFLMGGPGAASGYGAFSEATGIPYQIGQGEEAFARGAGTTGQIGQGQTGLADYINNLIKGNVGQYLDYLKTGIQPAEFGAGAAQTAGGQIGGAQAGTAEQIAGLQTGAGLLPLQGAALQQQQQQGAGANLATLGAGIAKALPALFSLV